MKLAASLAVALMIAGCTGNTPVSTTSDPCAEPRQAWDDYQAFDDETGFAEEDLFGAEARLLVVEPVAVIVEQNPDCFSATERAEIEAIYRRLTRAAMRDSIGGG